jgi:hydroxymethylpyrimidine pyrophosphatase-like HAD family hydrolase
MKNIILCDLDGTLVMSGTDCTTSKTLTGR